MERSLVRMGSLMISDAAGNSVPKFCARWMSTVERGKWSVGRRLTLTGTVAEWIGVSSRMVLMREKVLQESEERETGDMMLENE